MEICLDVWQEIVNLLDLKSQLHLTSTCHYLYTNLKIRKLLINKFNPLILQTIRFDSLRVLITSCHILSCHILQKHIDHLNLTIFHCESPFVTSVNHMTRLEVIRLRLRLWH